MQANANIASHLPLQATRNPYQLAVVFPHGRDHASRVAYVHWTFQQLNAESDRLAHGLEAIGISQGVRTVLMVKPSLEFFSLTFALFKVGAIPVMVDPGIGIKNLGQCLAEAEPAAFVGITKAHLARRILGWGRNSIRHCVTVGKRLFWGGHTLADLQSLGKNEPYDMVVPNDTDMAAILFTSGSTGVPKGAVYSHGIFNAQVELLRETYGIASGTIDLTTFPLFALFAPALGMTAIIPDMDATKPAEVDPRKIIEAIENFGVQNMFGSPALLNRVSLYGQKNGIRLPSLQRVLSAGAPVSATIIERFAAMLPENAEIHTPYGATESLPVSSIGSREILEETRHLTDAGKGVCVGRPVRGINLRIIGISDDAIDNWDEAQELPTGEIGEICVQGPQVTREYFRREQATKLAKIRDGDSFYHRMGDLGYFDEKGRLWVCGRKSHRVQTKAGTLFTLNCEGVFNTHSDVFRTALVGVGLAGEAKPVLCVEKMPGCQTSESALTKDLLAIAAQHPHTKTIQTVLFHPKFPVDIRHNAKIFREKLAVWAERKLA